jgi:putative nucleotidyltransferase with HDIG domain
VRGMAKLLLFSYELKPGMTVAETILNDYGAIVVSEGTILDEHIIQKLCNLNLPQIKVICDEDNVPVHEPEDHFKIQYNENLECVKDILHDLGTGNSIDMEKINNVADSVVIGADQNKDIVRCLNQIKSSDEYLYTHSINVSLLSMLLGKWLGLDAVEIKQLVQAGLLHDIGKVKVSPQILNKPGKLTKEEYEEIKKHTVYGYRILEKEKDISRDICAAVLMHHEKEDGSGYPMGITGKKINKLAKIISVADIYDAMTSNRVYKGKESAFQVFRMMEQEAIGKLDISVVNALLNNLASYYIGDFARLNNGQICEILYINPRHVSRPIVRVEGNYVDLLKETDLIIEEIL